MRQNDRQACVNVAGPDYVARIHPGGVDRARWFSVGALARPAREELAAAGRAAFFVARQDTRLASRLVEKMSAPPIPLADKDGRIVGVLHRDDALAVQLGAQTKP